MFARIESKIMECGWSDPGVVSRRQPHQIDTVILHRFGARKGHVATCAPDFPTHQPPHPLGENAVEVADWFRQHPTVLGTPVMPYTFVIRRDGVIEQAMWLACITPHARRWNTRGVGVMLIGDFRLEPPPSEQVEAAAALITRLNDTMRRSLAIYGHSMYTVDPQADAGHQCPGKFFEQAYKEIRAQVKSCGAVNMGI